MTLRLLKIVSIEHSTPHRLKVWGESWLGDDHVIDVHMSNLRRKLGDADYVRTVRGFGYRMGEG